MGDYRRGERYVADQIGCARCGADGHEQLEYRPLTNPWRIDDTREVTHFATCPVLFEPILLVVSTPVEPVMIHFCIAEPGCTAELHVEGCPERTL